MHRLLGEEAGAQASCDEAMKIYAGMDDNVSPEAMVELARMLLARGEHAAAVEQMQRAIGNRHEDEGLLQEVVGKYSAMPAWRKRANGSSRGCGTKWSGSITTVSIWRRRGDWRRPLNCSSRRYATCRESHHQLEYGQGHAFEDEARRTQ
ncbi:MAG: hypothetical protein IPK65_06565 [Gammaproteobacteria bacterium]|nr:hypothetical protein [Gammaproteobacteria bacterium]